MTIESYQAVGLLSNWRIKSTSKNNPINYEKTWNQVAIITDKAKGLGVQMYGNYECRWAADSDYFTFWIYPNFRVFESLISELENSGLYRYIDCENIIGLQGSGDKISDQGHILSNMILSCINGNPKNPLAFIALWKRTNSFYLAQPNEISKSSQAVTEVFDNARQLGVLTFGRFECRWSSQWNYFTFWLAPNFEVLESVFEDLERVGDFYYADPKHGIGLLNPEIKTYLPKGF